MMRDHNVEALPVWAQDKIRYLQSNLSDAKAELIKRDANVKTDIIVDRYHDTPVYLPENKAIAFNFDKVRPEEFIEFRFARDSKGNKVGVDVYASSFGLELGFFPSSGNTGRLLLVKSR